MTVKNDTTNVKERVNIPPRSVNRGYYANLTQLYDHLHIQLRRVRHRFIYAQVPEAPQLQTTKSDKDNDKQQQHPGTEAVAHTYFVSDSLHQLLRSAQFNRGWLQRLGQFLFLGACYAWLIFCCFFFQPHSQTDTDATEPLQSYLRRIRLPQKFVDYHLFPVLSAICTCSHEQLSDFPASDLTNFMKLSTLRRTYMTDGVNEVQSRLVRGIQDIRLGALVKKVQILDHGVQIKWEQQKDGVQGPMQAETFDRVVISVTPNVTASIFEPASKALGSIPTGRVEASIIDPSTTQQRISVEEHGQAPSRGLFSQHNELQPMAFYTTFSASDAQTEAWHYLPSGAISKTSNNLAAPEVGKVLHKAQFTRTLRTVKSRSAVQSIFRPSATKPNSDGTVTSPETWVSGNDNVWVAGSWCWDGMVLLEGCVVSAMRVADDFGVEVPWRK